MSRGIACCIRRAHYPKRLSVALFADRPRAAAAPLSASAVLFNPGIGAAAVIGSGRGYFRASSISEVMMTGGADGEGGSGSGYTSESHKFTNRLAKEHSPYLLQHAHNPVSIPIPIAITIAIATWTILLVELIVRNSFVTLNDLGICCYRRSASLMALFRPPIMRKMTLVMIDCVVREFL